MRKTLKKHPGVGELDLIVGVHAPGEVRKTHHVSAHSPFPAMAATSCGMPVDILKLLIHQADSAPSRHFFVIQLCRSA